MIYTLGLHISLLSQILCNITYVIGTEVVVSFLLHLFPVLLVELWLR